MRLIAVAAIVIPLVSSGIALAATPAEEQARIACQLGGACTKATKEPEAAEPSSDGSVAVGDERGFDMFRRSGAIAPQPVALASAAMPGARRGATFADVGASPAAHRPRVTRVSFRQASGPTARPRGTADMALQFGNGSADLSADAKGKIAIFAKVLIDPSRRLTDARFAIEGHTNSVGGRDYNVDLSRRRAQAVVDYLVTLGVSRDRLTPEGLGFDKPLPGLTSADANNRRVEIVKAG